MQKEQDERKDKKIKEIKREPRGYTISVEDEDHKKYDIFVNDTEMTDLEYTKQLIKNRIQMSKKHQENITKLINSDT